MRTGQALDIRGETKAFVFERGERITGGNEGQALRESFQGFSSPVRIGHGEFRVGEKRNAPRPAPSSRTP